MFISSARIEKLTVVPSRIVADSMDMLKKIGLIAASAILLISSGCGYHTAGQATRIPSNIRNIAIPAFGNQTQTFASSKKSLRRWFVSLLAARNSA